MQAGAITISPAASAVQAGLPFIHRIKPMPPNPIGSGGQGSARRPVEVRFMLENTQALTADIGSGLRDIPLRKRPSVLFPDPLQPFSGEVRLRTMGWTKSPDKSVWSIEQSTPLPFTLLAVTVEMKVSE